ncbi:MAG: acetate--CoA ligase family protein [Dehalococcoidia bacterium]
MDKLSELRPLFYPRTVAVVGVSKDEMKFGSRFLQALLNFGFKGSVYPVHPTETEILGLKAYPSVREVPEPVDLAAIMVPAPHVPAVLEDCLAAGVKGAEVFTSGFAETGDEQGKALERELTLIARRGIRIVGPNCFGIYCPGGGLTLLPGGNFPRESGPVAFISQSGGHAVELGREARGRGIRFSKAISYGNGCDLNEADLLEYMAQDDETRIVAMYIEGPREGRRFAQLVRELAPRKPIVIWKAGLTRAGGRAVHSHTASLGGEEAIWQALFKQTAAIPVHSLEELADTVLAFLQLPPSSGRRVGVVGGGGGISVAAADACDRAGLDVPPFDDDVQQKLQAILPPAGTSIRNPVDIGAPLVAPQVFERVLESVAAAECVDTVIATQAMFHFFAGTLKPPPGEEERVLQALIEAPVRVRDKFRKPVVIVLPVGSDDVEMLQAEKGRREIRDHYLSMGIPSYPTLERAARAVANVASYYAKTG